MTWPEIYGSWLMSVQELDMPMDDLTPFQMVEVDSNQPYFGVDWWPKSDSSRRLDYLRKGYLPFWETRRGTLHTAELLFQNKGNREKQGAILILASIDVKRKELPEGWRGPTNRLMTEVFRVVREAFPDIENWHHASREALPSTIGRYYPACEFIVPRTEGHLLYLFALEASLSLMIWQLVKYLSPRYIRGEEATRYG